MDVNEYKQEFLQEAREYLDELNKNFIELEKGNSDVINEIFRMAHTIKGMAGFMNYKTLEELCHTLENVLGKIRDGEINVNEEIIDLMLKAVDKIEEILDRIESEDNDEVDIRDVLTNLRKVIEKDVKVDTGVDKNRDFAQADIRIDVKLTDDCVMKGVRAALVVESLSEIAEVLGTIPDEDKMDEKDFDGSFSVFIKGGDVERIEKVMNNIAEVERFEIHRLSPDEDKEIKGDRKDIKEKEEKQDKKFETIRVSIEHLDNIMNLVGELVIGKSRLLQVAQEYDIPELKEAVDIMDKCIASLQDEIMRIRMVKIERILNKFPKMVRDLARKLGKKVELIIKGQDTELDRTVLDEIHDPLVHLVRNAIDHGIEPPDERKTKGKDEVGRIVISAMREKNNVIIEIEDDGRGLDLEKIKEKAIERGLISPSEAESISDDEIKMLIFTPGFSTKDKPTEISGRGVGMDVVKSRIEKLGGSIKVFSEKDKGTKIRITLPPTVAIIKALLVRVGKEDYAIPLSNVIEALYVTDENWKVIHGNEFLYVRGKLIPAFKLRDLFKVRDGHPEKEVGIIVEREGERYALIVDAITDQQEIVIKPLSNFLAKIKGFSGVTILGDGRVIPIIDVTTLLGG